MILFCVWIYFCKLIASDKKIWTENRTNSDTVDSKVIVGIFYVDDLTKFLGGA